MNEGTDKMHFRKRLIAVAALFAMVAAVIYGSTLEITGEQEDSGPRSWFDRKDTIY